MTSVPHLYARWLHNKHAACQRRKYRYRHDLSRDSNSGSNTFSPQLTKKDANGEITGIA
jgi:hypothetical protein